MGFGDMFSRSMDPPPAGGAAPRSHKAAVWLLAVAAILAGAAVLGGMVYYYSYRPIYLRIAVGPPNSEDVKVIQSLAQVFARDRQRVRLRPVITEGAVASGENLSAGTVDLAVVRGDLDLPSEAQAVAGLRKNYAVLWAPGGRKGAVKKIEQLAGKRVGVIGRTQANVNLLKVMLAQSGVKPESVQVVQFPAIGFAEAIKTEKLDAFLAVGPLNSRITAEAINLTTRDGKDATFLTLDTADAVAQKFPRYDSGEIPAGTFGAKPPRPSDKIDTIVFSHHIVASKALSETTVGTLTRQLFAARQQIQSEFPMGAKLETPDTDKAAAIPVHPGAAAYVDGEEKSFLDRYSDYIWGGLMVLSAMGSAGAWFASYLRRDEREINVTQRERLLEMLRAARKSTSMEELDAMQAEADDILGDTLHCFEDGAIEEGSLTAFSIALEQFHNAVADRKTFLLEVQDEPVRPAKPHSHVA
jgi:TRAP transporter TAXI family solute receptor